MKYELSGGLYYMSTYIKRLLIIFWTILLLIVAISITITIFTEGIMQFDLTFPIYIFSGILGFTIVKAVYPYLIKMGITRKVIFLITGISFFIVALLNTFILQVVYKFTDWLYAVLKIDKVNGSAIIFTYNGQETNYRHLAQFINDTVSTRVIIDMSIMLFLVFLMLIIGLMFYNYGAVAGVSLLVVLFIGFIGLMTSGYFIDFINYIFNNFEIVLFYQLISIAFIIYLLSYLGIYRLTIKQ